MASSFQVNRAVLSAGLPGAVGDPLGERVPGGGGAGVDGTPPLAVLGRLDVEVPGDLDDLAVHGHDPDSGIELVGGEGGQLAPPQPGIGGGLGHQLVAVPVPPGPSVSGSEQLSVVRGAPWPRSVVLVNSA